MKIIDVPQPGGPEALVLAQRDIPQPTDGQVLIQVVAAGVNRADVLQRRGVYPAPAGAADYPGLEVSGRIHAIGNQVTEFNVGDQVCALLQGGGYAEYCVAPVEQVLPLPAGVDLQSAASIPETFFTVWSNVFMFGRLADGETLLVHGGSSGIGSAAIQLATILGHRVFATAGSDEKCRYCIGLGAVNALNYKNGDFVAGVRAANGGRGIDVVLDMIAGEYTARNVAVLADEGRLVIIATQGGAESKIDVGRLMGKRASITGSTLRPRNVAFKASVKRQLLSQVWPLWREGRLRITIDRVFPLAEAAAAHRHMESSAHMGKILLAVAPA
jgi:NADPH:quinone reductase